MLYLALLIVASVFFFFLLLGYGLAGNISLKIFLVTIALAIFWGVTYVRQSALKSKLQYKKLFSLSGTIVIYNLLLSTPFLDPTAIQHGWIFIGTPVIMLFIWYFLMYEVIQKNITIHWLVWVIFVIILLFYALDTTWFYYKNII